MSIPSKAISRARSFITSQKRNYRVAITRSAASSFLLSLTAQYNSIYTVGLGADSVLLGFISSIGGAINALISTPVGWLADRYGIKRMFSLAMVLLALGSLCYGLAPDWRLIIAATLLISIAQRLTGTGCSVICVDALENKARVTAQNLCVTFASLASMVSPLIAAYLITLRGGLEVENIRPLYYIRALGFGAVTLFVVTQLKEPLRRRDSQREPRTRFLDDFRSLFRQNNTLWRWIAISGLASFSLAMETPFRMLFAHQEKGANQYLLGVMATTAILMRLLLGIPLGRLADRIGRKKMIYMLTPLAYLSNLLLVLSVNSTMLVASGALQTFRAIATGAASAMTMELLPVEQTGRWSGLLGLFRGLFAIPAPILGGLIWRNMGPVYVFLLPVAIDLFLRLPLLISVPETLHAGRGSD